MHIQEVKKGENPGKNMGVHCKWLDFVDFNDFSGWLVVIVGDLTHYITKRLNLNYWLVALSVIYFLGFLKGHTQADILKASKFKLKCKFKPKKSKQFPTFFVNKKTYPFLNRSWWRKKHGTKSQLLGPRCSGDGTRGSYGLLANGSRPGIFQLPIYPLVI
jgi:hypothetical protein